LGATAIQVTLADRLAKNITAYLSHYGLLIGADLTASFEGFADFDGRLSQSKTRALELAADH
jgi:hypothetical protein